jgi:hypothetical protein
LADIPAPSSGGDGPPLEQFFRVTIADLAAG